VSVDAKRLQDAFLAAVEADDPAQQAAILDRECAGDPELRRRVEALLQAHRNPASVLDRPAVAPLRAAPEPVTGTERCPAPRGQEEFWAGVSAVGSFSGRDEPTGAEDRSLLGFLAPPMKPGGLGRLGHYEVLQVLGRGGFGIVLRAFDEVLQRVVAVKVLAPAIAATSPARKRFLREARSSAAIRHENVVQVYAVEEQPLPYLVMEFIPGETLQQMLDRTGPLDVPEVLRIGCQIGEGLAAAHGTGLIHRDVKPGNVLIEGGPRRQVKLTDFGLARAADDASISHSGLIAGTPLYMAPEQARGETLDHRADLFSLGSVLYVMCTGRPPFRASGSMAILKRVCEDNPRPIREIIPETPVWLCDLITRLHAKDPAERFQSAREVVDLLQRYQAELATFGKVVPVPLPSTRPKRARSIQLGVAAAATLIGVLAFVLPRWSSPGPGELGNEPSKKQPWQPRLPLTPEELSRLSSPFDAFDRANLPKSAMARMFGGADKAPPKLVAILDGSPSRLPRPGRTSWFAQDRAGKWLAVPCETEVVLFDPRTMAPVKTLGTAAERIYRVVFSPDGKRLAAGVWSDQDSVVVWDVETGEQTLRLNQKGGCWSIQFSPDGGRLITVGEDQTPIVWDARSGKELNKFPSHDQPVYSDALFTADGQQIVTLARGGAVKVWDAKTWGEVRRLDGPERPNQDLPAGRHLPLVMSPDGKWLAAGSESGLKVWATDDWKERFSADAASTWLVFAPDGRTLLTGPHACSEEQWHVVTRWDMQTGQRRSMTLGSRGPWAVYHLSSDGRTLYGMACDPAEPAIHVYDADTGEERYLPGHTGRVCAVDISPDGVWIASAGSDGTARVWGVDPPRLLHTIPRPGKTAGQVVFSPDGKTLYAAWNEDGVIRAIDPESGRWRELGVYGPRLRRMAVAPDGTLLAAVGEGGVRLWMLPDGTPRGEVAGAPPASWSIAFSPDANTLAVGGMESVRLFEVATGRSVRTLEFPGKVRWVGFRPDGQSLAVAGESVDNPVLLFDVSTGAHTLRLEGDETPLQSGAWRADGSLLATAGASGGTIWVWDFGHAVPKRSAVAVFEPNIHGIEALAFTPEGRHLLAANPDGTIAVLRLAKAGDVFRVP
jgi:serine/threonine protein kinase/WD40 repeat protein